MVIWLLKDKKGLKIKQTLKKSLTAQLMDIFSQLLAWRYKIQTSLLKTETPLKLLLSKKNCASGNNISGEISYVGCQRRRFTTGGR